VQAFFCGSGFPAAIIEAESSPTFNQQYRVLLHAITRQLSSGLKARTFEEQIVAPYSICADGSGGLDAVRIDRRGRPPA
jgi:hypothetical protein